MDTIPRFTQNEKCAWNSFPSTWRPVAHWWNMFQGEMCMKHVSRTMFLKPSMKAWSRTLEKRVSYMWTSDQYMNLLFNRQICASQYDVGCGGRCYTLVVDQKTKTPMAAPSLDSLHKYTTARIWLLLPLVQGVTKRSRTFRQHPYLGTEVGGKFRNSQLVSPSTQKTDTNCCKCIRPDERLIVTLRWLSESAVVPLERIGVSGNQLGSWFPLAWHLADDTTSTRELVWSVWPI